MSLATPTYVEIAETSTSEDLERIMIRGERPDLDALPGWEYRGTNIAFWAEYSPILKFVKGFYREPGSGLVYGYNEPVLQNSRHCPWIVKPSDADPKRFGFYSVAYVDPAARDNAYLHAVLLDYSKGRNPFLDPSKRLRDYLVRVEPGSDALLLGKAYLAFGPARVATNYFLLERHRETSFVREG